jgi:hypothetical protein
MFPSEQLIAMLRLLNIWLEKVGGKLATMGELLKWFALLILITRFDFGNQRDLWHDTKWGRDPGCTVWKVWDHDLTKSSEGCRGRS